MKRYTKSIEVNDIEKIDNQESKNINIKIDETISNTNNPSVPTLDNEKEKLKLEKEDSMNNSNIEKKNDDDDDEDEYFKQPLMRVHRMSINSKDLGKLRRKLSVNNEKEKEKERKEVSIDKDLALKAALNYFGKRLESFHGGRLNTDRNRSNNSHSDYFNKKKAFNKNLTNNRTKPNLTIYKENEENEEKSNKKDEEIKRKEKEEKKEKKEEEIKKDEKESDDGKKNEEKIKEKNEDNNIEDEDKYTKKFRVIVNRKKYTERNNISHEEKEENSIDYYRKKNKQNDEEKEYLNFTERKNYKNIGRRKFIINNSPKNKNEENKEIKNIISQRGRQNIIYRKKEIPNYYKEKGKEKEKKQNIKEILNENNSQNLIKVRRYQRILAEDGINDNKKNENRKEREVQKERKKDIQKFIQTPEKTGHSFYRRYRINNENKNNDSTHNLSFKPNAGLISPNYSNSMIKNPIKLTNKINNQIPLHKINVNNNNNHHRRSKLISETPKEKESISYTGYMRKVLNDKKNLGSKEKDNGKTGLIKRGALQINTNYSNSFIRNNVNRKEEKLFENKYGRYNASSKDKKYEINHTTNYINTEGKIRINNRQNIIDKKQNYKNDNKTINKNINHNANKNVAKYVDRRSKNNKSI
mgnify:FL=1